MMGYDVGARFSPDEEAVGLFGGTDAALPLDQSLVDDVFASSARLPHMVPDATDDVSELIGALGDAADSAGKMHVAGAVSDPLNPEQGAAMESMSAILAAQLAGAVMAGGAGGKIGPSDLDYGDVPAAVAGVNAREEPTGLEGLDQTHYFGQRDAQGESIWRRAGSLDFANESNADCGIGDNPLAKFEDLYFKSIAELGEGIGSGDASVLGALTGSGLTRSGEAAAERGAVLEQNDQGVLGFGHGIEKAPSKGELEVLLDSIDKEKYPTNVENFSGPEGEFYPFIDGGIQDFGVHEISRRAADRPQLAAVGIPDAGPMMLAPSSDGDETPGVEGLPDLSGLWGMLLDAERILPKPSLADTADDPQEAANEIEIRPNHSPGMLNRLVAAGPANHRQADDSSMLDERVAAANGRSGPTGHRNDPIYTVAIGSMTGTLMPMVPTPGTNTRSPPLPGQRNLP